MTKIISAGTLSLTHEAANILHASNNGGYAGRPSEVKRILGALIESIEATPDATSQDGLSIAREHDLIVKAWEAGDIEGEIDGDEDFADLTDEQRHDLIRIAQTTGPWRSLADAFDTDWEHVRQAINEAAEEIGIEARA